jgi:myo-inositol-1(or 4)-monophosphatase
MQELLTGVVEAAIEAGAEIRRLYERGCAVTEKAADHPVTEADLASNEILERRLRALAPEFGWLSEESVDDPERLRCPLLWVVDPLDGTREFVNGVEEFVVSIGIVREGRAVAGVLHNPIRGDLFSGIVGVGARFMGESCRVTGRSSLEGARILCSRTDHRRGLLSALSTRGLALEPMGSQAYKIGLVAAGLADGTFTRNARSEWDVCAGVALVEAAGGRCSDIAGEAFSFNRAFPEVRGICAANPLLHTELLARVAQA